MLEQSAVQIPRALETTVLHSRPMRPIAAALLVVAMSSTATMQERGQAKPQLPKSQVPDLGRPTRPGDEQPPFNFGEYFVGTWTFSWDVPEGALGPTGTITGSVTYKQVDGPFFEATTKASGPGGAFTVKESIAYRLEGKTAARWLTDSRGFSYAQLATVGGDLGGYFNLYFEGSPFTYQGKTIRVKNALRLTSPLRYRSTVTVSTDGGPFVNYGSAWFEKDAGGRQ